MKENLIGKLDLLQFKYENLDPPRFPLSRKLAKSKNAHHVKLLTLSEDEALKMIKQLKRELFERKYHSAYSKLERHLGGQIRQVLKNKTTKPEDRKLYEKLESELDKVIKQKLTKLGSKIFHREEVRGVPPESFWEDREKLKGHTYETELNNLVSRLFNKNTVKEVVQQTEHNFKLVLGVDKREKKPETAKQTESEKNTLEDESESSGDDSDETSVSEDTESSDDEKLDAIYSDYKSMVAGSSEEDDGELEEGVNYNQVTDEEPSEQSSESDDEQPDYESAKAERKKLGSDDFFSELQLPALAGGYYSGGEDEEELEQAEKDMKKLAKERKNRRGQRARQKIWEKKYGKNANHVKKERERVQSEREKQRLAYEERVRKRAEKKKQEEEKKKQAQEKPRQPSAADKMHPSWEAKRRAEEALKNVKFQGKKVKFE
ncbi:hypothetical protein KL928_005056 [Ogataea angusta]|uniref:Bud22 domain-containing protein n=1 Tax=Pichia angusta TaxID=870730 RepID=A0AAN6DAW6_PICAN|nr:uncharacterized protein KL928_005056 [Ogataea angusta]KAG7816090.1 hypothetical protein KL928_005056 [Ogataea angusta]